METWISYGALTCEVESVSSARTLILNVLEFGFETFPISSEDGSSSFVASKLVFQLNVPVAFIPHLSSV